MSSEDIVEQVDMLVGIYFGRRLKEEIGKKPIVVFSVHKNDSRGMPINNIEEVPLKGKFKISHDGYVSSEMENPTWLEISTVVNEILVNTGEKKKIYLEDIYKSRDGKAEVFMGS